MPFLQDIIPLVMLNIAYKISRPANCSRLLTLILEISLTTLTVIGEAKRAIPRFNPRSASIDVQDGLLSEMANVTVKGAYGG